MRGRQRLRRVHQAGHALSVHRSRSAANGGSSSSGIRKDPQATAVYSAILRLADACGCDVVAEGVEEASHADFLVDNGCWIGQGFHFSRPVPGLDCTALLDASIATERRR